MSNYRAIICTSQVPLVRFGGTEALVDRLQQALQGRGLQVDVVRIPFRHYPKSEILKGHLMWRLLNLSESEGNKIDLVIATKFPSFLVQHPNKVTWLVHQFRQAYDWVGTPLSAFDPNEDRSLLQAIRHMDTKALAESRRLFAISRNVAARLARYNGLQAVPLYPPPQFEGQYRSEGYGDFVLSPSRLSDLKRIHLLVEALALTRSMVRCVIVGEGQEEAALKNLVRERGLGGRVEFLGGVESERLLYLYANCLAVFFAPYDEDYGLVTLEAFKSHKPVLTAADSGGVLEFVEDGLTGCVAPTGSPQEFAGYIDRLFADRALCRSLGDAGYDKVRDITWERTIDQLLGT